MSIFYMLLILSLWGCEAVPQTVVSIDTEQVVNEDYIGNGAQ